MNWTSRTELLIGTDAVKRLKSSRVAVFGAGGVGGYIVEALVRAGVGALEIWDSDRFEESNLNRQLAALKSTVGMLKTDAVKARCLDINPDIEIAVHNDFVTYENAREIDFSRFDYVADAIDTVTAKVGIAKRCQKQGIPIICCLGTGFRLRTDGFKIVDIHATSVCPLAKTVRKLCRDEGITTLEVLYSTEPPRGYKEKPEETQTPDRKKTPPASISFVPAAAGLMIAGHIISKLIGLDA